MDKVKTILVFGGGGFIGHHLARRLKNEGHTVVCVDIKSDEEASEYCPLSSFCTYYVQADLRDIISVTSLVEHYKPDELYQLAADMGGAGFVFTGENDADLMTNSVLINVNTLLAVHAFSRDTKVFYSSSACMYPAYNQEDPENPNCKENSAYPANPDSEYGWEKLFSERLYLAYHRNHDIDVRIARFHNIFGPCFDDQTEILTENGWKFFESLTKTEKVCTLNIETNKVEYQLPLAYQKYAYDGEMKRFTNQAIDLLVTPEHQIFWKSNVKSKWKLSKICDISNKIIRFSREFNYDFESFNHKFWLDECLKSDGRKHQDKKEISIDLWLQFLGWYLSEGSCFRTPTNYTVCITQSQEKNPENCAQISKLLNEIGFTYHINENNFIISSKQLFLECSKYGKSQNKFIPRWIFDLPNEKLQILFKTLMLGDGNKSSRRYSTSSKQLADDVQIIALRLGFGASISIEQNKQFIIYRVNFSNEKQHRVKITDEFYEGFVYDVTVPNHTLFVRRNGKVCWSGNCGTWTGGREKAPAALCRKVAENDNGIIDIWGDGKQTRSFLYIDECVEGVLRLMNSDFIGPVNIGSDEMVTINELAQTIANIAGKNISLNHIPGPQGVRGRNSDNTLICEKLDWKPTQTLREGLEKTYPWIKEQVKNVK